MNMAKGRYEDALFLIQLLLRNHPTINQRLTISER